MKRYFYARVSTKDQNVNRQLKRAESYATDYAKIFLEMESGKNFDRPKYQELKAILQAGDEVVFTNLDRLGRDKDGIKKELEWFKQNNITVRILDLPTTLIDFAEQGWIGDMVNNILIEVMGAIAEQERLTTLQRVQDGIDAMPVINGKKTSVKTGRPVGRTPLTDRISKEKFMGLYEKTQSGQMKVWEAVLELGVTNKSWYNLRDIYVSGGGGLNGG